MGGSRPFGGGGGSGAPLFGPRCRLFNIGTKVGPPPGPPFLACRPKMDPPTFSKILDITMVFIRCLYQTPKDYYVTEIAEEVKRVIFRKYLSIDFTAYFNSDTSGTRKFTSHIVGKRLRIWFKARTNFSYFHINTHHSVNDQVDLYKVIIKFWYGNIYF